MSEMWMWVVYEPDVTHQSYRALEWHVSSEGGVTLGEGSMHAGDIDMIRGLLRTSGLMRMERWPDDEPNIVEIWV